MDQQDGDQKIATRPTRRPWFWIFCLIVGVLIGQGLAKLHERYVARVNLEIIGRDVSGAGGAVIFVSSTDGYVRQTCNGVCDTLSYKFKSRSPEYTVKIDGPDGTCVFCPGTYTTDYMNNHEMIAGAPKLALTPVDAGTP